MKPTARLISVKPRKDNQRQVMTMKGHEAVIGRQFGCKVRIPSPAVSRQHCKLTFLNDLLTAEDLGSSNGTYINDVRIHEQSYIKPGDVLRIGPYRFLVDYRLTDRAVNHLLEYLSGGSGESIDVEIVEAPDASMEAAEVLLESDPTPPPVPPQK